MKVSAALFMTAGAGYVLAGAIGAYARFAEGSIPGAVLSMVTVASGAVVIICGIRIWRMS